MPYTLFLFRNTVVAGELKFDELHHHLNLYGIYLKSCDSIAFLPTKAIQGLDLVTIELEDKPESFDVIAAWHPRYNDDALLNWIMSLFKAHYFTHSDESNFN